MNHRIALLLGCCLASASFAHAQDTSPPAAPPMSPEQQAMMAAWEKAASPGAPHRLLAEHFLGQWEARQTLWMPGNPQPMQATGQATTTAELGGRQLRMRYTGTMMGAPFEGWSLNGYDNVSGKYTGLWVDNMSTGTYTTTGDYDAASRTYTYTGQWPDPMQAGQLLKVRETVAIVDADHHVMEMFEQHDGKEVRTMRIEFSRVR